MKIVAIVGAGKGLGLSLASIKAAYGSIDVMEFSPTPRNYPPTSVLHLTPENAQNQFEGYVAIMLPICMPSCLPRELMSSIVRSGCS